MEKIKCQRCQHEWLPRVEGVKECPKCKSRLWNVLKKSKIFTENFWDGLLREMEKKKNETSQ